jgi:hypothetical protein
VDRDTIKGVVEHYIPPLSEKLVNEIAEAIFSQIEKESQSQPVTASSGERTQRKRKQNRMLE